ncbi:hypothetical protein V1508DRAFT_395719 [Lipomyces doorenjongii]|uniref:uncharacterized protein n=1 Tax=Lipomyces doorenjongii TaxID=383834 RepID=UPI0034CE284D
MGMPGVDIFFRQPWALAKKTLLIVVVRRWYTTLIRAVLLPVAFVVLLANLKNFLVASNGYASVVHYQCKALSAMSKPAEWLQQVLIKKEYFKEDFAITEPMFLKPQDVHRVGEPFVTVKKENGGLREPEDISCYNYVFIRAVDIKDKRQHEIYELRRNYLSLLRTSTGNRASYSVVLWSLLIQYVMTDTYTHRWIF